MAEKLQAPRGTFDVLPPGGERRRALTRACEDLFARHGYRYTETPAFEDTEVFARGVGESTDIVQKEMFTFEDKGGRSLTLRPENTAGICRAYMQHGMHKLPQPVKLWYWGSFFRHEAPQAGRYRQFNQVGIEALGSDDPSLDAEVILVLAEVLEAAGAKQLRLKLASLGSLETRRAYLDQLRAHLRTHESQLSEEVIARLDSNPLRAFDSAHEGTRAVTAEAPKLIDSLSPEDAEHFAAVRELLDGAGVAYDIDPSLVRGLDYYTRTVFEFDSAALGAQSGVGGGGRYDSLVEQLGGPHTPGVGWAAGVERILLAAGEAEEAPAAPDVYVGAGGFAIARELRERGVHVQLEQAGRSLKGQLKAADRSGARFALLLQDDGLQLKDLSNGEQSGVAGVDELVERLR